MHIWHWYEADDHLFIYRHNVHSSKFLPLVEMLKTKHYSLWSWLSFSEQEKLLPLLEEMKAEEQDCLLRMLNDHRTELVHFTFYTQVIDQLLNLFTHLSSIHRSNLLRLLQQMDLQEQEKLISVMDSLKESERVELLGILDELKVRQQQILLKVFDVTESYGEFSLYYINLHNTSYAWIHK